MARKRGRPPTFHAQDRQHFADLIRQHGVRGARDASDVPVCCKTLIKIAREFDIPLKSGRRPRKAA